MGDLVDLLRRSTGRGLQNIQYAMPEALRNYVGKAEWDEKKNAQDFYGGDFEAQERADKMMGFGTDAAGLVGAIKASHGTPHRFDRFSMDKIGTGEGAQAYGHGMYFAQGFDSPTAKEYQKQLAADVQLKGQPFYSGRTGKQMATTGNSELDDYLLANLGDVSSARSNLLNDLREVRQSGGDIKDYQRTLADLRKVRGDVENANTGHLYNVELKWPDAAREAADPLGEHHLLDWDASLGEQPATVQKAWEKFLSSKAGQSADKSMRGDLFAKKGQYANPTGSDIYGALAEGLIGYGKPRPFMQVKQEASERLRKAGIPGIRYLDQGSRGAGEGSRNYVIFDDAIPEIVTRNGEAVAKALRGAK